MEIDLSNDDLKIIGSAITWTLYTPFSRSSSPEFSGEERQRLQIIFDSLCRYRHEAGSSFEARINDMGLIAGDNLLTSNSHEVVHIIVCVRSFRSEIGHSPDEVLAVTGLPIAQLDSLVGRLSKLERSECV